MEEEMKFDTVDDMVKQAEATFQKGIGTFREWGEQARELIENQPGMIELAAGVSGLLVGTILHRSFSMRRSPAASKPKVDPMIFVAGGVVAGLLFGTKLVELAISALESSHGARDLEPHLRAVGSMNQRPFEKL